MSQWHIQAAPIPADHPCLPGHFPGKPIVPGTLLLERVITTLTAHHPEHWVCEVVSAKFLAPLKPEQPFSIHYRERDAATRFECRLDDAPLAAGELKLARRVTDPEHV